MSRPAIRKIDSHVCPCHGPVTIEAAAELDVLVNREPALRVGHAFTCGGQPTTITTGAATVRFHGDLAARAFDATGHDGVLAPGSHNVVIGGPTGIGNLGAGIRLCEKAALGRASGSTKQSYGNCVLESLRQLLLQAGHDVSEDELAGYAEAKGYYCKDSGIVNGGTRGVELLAEFGIPAERMPRDGAATVETVKTAMVEGRSVVAFVDGPMWYPGMRFDGPRPQHAVVVIGVELDERGEVAAVFVNDTGVAEGSCGQRVPVSRFGPALARNGSALLVTAR